MSGVLNVLLVLCLTSWLDIILLDDIFFSLSSGSSVAISFAGNLIFFVCIFKFVYLIFLFFLKILFIF